MSNTLRFDWASASVIFVAFVLPVVLSWGVNRWWTTRERTQQLAAQQEGAVFSIPPLFRTPLLFVLFALAAISLFLLIATLNGPQTGITVEAGLEISLLFAPLIVGSLIFLLRNTGMVVLTAEGVSLRRVGRGRFLRYRVGMKKLGFCFMTSSPKYSSIMNSSKSLRKHCP